MVGRVASVAPVWQVNEFGDRLIVSVMRVAVSETLGSPCRRSTSKWRAARLSVGLVLQRRQPDAGCRRHRGRKGALPLLPPPLAPTGLRIVS